MVSDAINDFVVPWKDQHSVLRIGAVTTAQDAGGL
jgi:hypothetical protein